MTDTDCAAMRLKQPSTEERCLINKSRVWCFTVNGKLRNNPQLEKSSVAFKHKRSNVVSKIRLQPSTEEVLLINIVTRLTFTVDGKLRNNPQLEKASVACNRWAGSIATEPWKAKALVPGKLLMCLPCWSMMETGTTLAQTFCYNAVS